MAMAYNPQQQRRDTTAAEIELSHAGEDRSQNHRQPCRSGTSDPPVNYMAYVIASRLLPMGSAMFNRRSDANCVLCVGDKRFYVHVQMLASRSPTFRRIFDDMIAHQAWGAEGENPSFYLDQDDDDAYEFSDSAMDGSSNNSSMVNDCDMEVTWTRLSDTHPLRHSHTDSQPEDNYGSDGSLPELCVALDDPEGGHIEELLYWLYTDDGPRWKASFNKGDYESVLKNIRHLDIVSPAVLAICKDFEASTAGSSVRGRAEKVLS